MHFPNKIKELRVRELRSRRGAGLAPLAKRLTLAVVAMGLAQPAHAFCGFYVAKADSKLFNKASKVVVARKGEQTAVTMASDYEGDLKEFALVIPVPVVVGKDQIKTVENATVDHLDAYSAPRLVEYHDPDPCAPPRIELMAKIGAVMSAAPMAAPPAQRRDKALGVTVEAEYTVGEYDILILSAKESDGLTTWLTEGGYKIPEGAASVLGSYIKQDMKFFVAKVNLKEQAKTGAHYLRPIQVSYTTAKFMLPIRLGTANANGPQDMIVMMLTQKGRVETTNYRTVKMPSNVEVPVYTKSEFGKFYKAMLDHQVKKDDMRMVYTEYAWDMGWCDPCAADPLPNDKLALLGATWAMPTPTDPSGPPNQAILPRRGGPAGSPVYVTRLHVRYDAAHFPEDLMFQETADRGNFQGRYVLRHPFTGTATCSAGDDYRRSLGLRFDQEATTLSSLTGWDLADIKRRMAENGQAIPR
jgi:hypothetical protein